MRFPKAFRAPAEFLKSEENCASVELLISPLPTSRLTRRDVDPAADGWREVVYTPITHGKGVTEQRFAEVVPRS